MYVDREQQEKYIIVTDTAKDYLILQDTPILLHETLRSVYKVDVHISAHLRLNLITIKCNV